MYAKNDLDREMIALEKQKLNAILGIQKKTKQSEEGDDYFFMMSLLPFMKNLDPLLKLELRGKIKTEIMNTYRMNQQLYAPTLMTFHNMPSTSTTQLTNNSSLSVDLLSGSSNSSSHPEFDRDFATNTYMKTFGGNN